MTRAFSLMELLVCLAIISLLFAVVSPVVVKSFNGSKQHLRRIYAWRDMQIGTFLDDKAPVSVLMWAATNTHLPYLDLVPPKTP